MRSLLRFLIKNHAFLLFLLLEVLSVVFIVNYNSFQRASYFNSSNAVSASVYNTYSGIAQYFRLAKVNSDLSAENAELRNSIDKLETSYQDSSAHFHAQETGFRYLSARVINNSVNKQQNYITLNKGRKHGVKPDQGIISSRGVVGIITNVSESYSMGLSLLNPRWSVSAKLKKSGYYGSLSWNGDNYKKAELNEIPFHVDLAVGDTIVTSGYSSVFPEGIMIGTVDELSRPEGENYYQIEVLLSADFKSVTHVEIIDNTRINELHLLKNETENAESGN